MELFGIGPLEFLFILVIILLVAGPRDVARGARGAGKLLNRLYKSPNYNALRRASEELRNLPERLVREAQLDELKDMPEIKELKEFGQEVTGAANSIAKPKGKPFQAWLEDMVDGPGKKPPIAPPGAPEPSDEKAAVATQIAAEPAEAPAPLDGPGTPNDAGQPAALEGAELHIPANGSQPAASEADPSVQSGTTPETQRQSPG